MEVESVELVSFVPCRFAELKADGWHMAGSFFVELFPKNFPAVLPDFKVMAAFAQNVGDKEKDDFELAIVSDKGEVVHGVFKKFATFDRFGWAVIEMDFKNVTVPVPGMYMFELRLSGRQYRPWSLLISNGEAIS